MSEDGEPRQALPVLTKLAGSGLRAGAGGMALREVRARMARGEPPASAEEYLLRVRLQADAMPEVLGGGGNDDDGNSYSNNYSNNYSNTADTADTAEPTEPAVGGVEQDGATAAENSPSYVVSSSSSSSSSPHPSLRGLLPDFARCPVDLRPDAAWQRRCAACFSECRQYMRRAQSKFPDRAAAARAADLPPLNDGYAWEKLCFGKSRGKGGATRGKAHPPLLSIVLSLGQPELLRLLNRHIKWLCANALPNDRGGAEDSTATPASTPASALAGGSLSRARAVWLYALMAGLEKPLHRNTAAMLRQLGRHCASLRATSIVSAKDPRLASLNVLLTLIEFAFGQGQQSR
jgi:hypothetical protein